MTRPNSTWANRFTQLGQSNAKVIVFVALRNEVDLRLFLVSWGLAPKPPGFYAWSH